MQWCVTFYIREAASKRAYEISGLENPNSVSQLKDWLNEKGIEVDSLAKAAVEELVEKTEGEVSEMMKLGLSMSKTSVKKYEAMERSVCPDGRVHGLLQFYGANRTGRWAGRLVQIHNLPQNHMEDLELARSIVKEGRYDLVELLYDSTPEVLSELIRTAFVAKPGCRFIVSDFSAIEARVMGYLAGEGWVMEEFRGAGKIYEQTASRCSISRSKKSQKEARTVQGESGITRLSVWRCGRCACQHGSIKFCGRRGTEGAGTVVADGKSAHRELLV